MPNWCYTTLNVNGSKEQIKELSALVSDAIENDNSLCNAIIPRPAAEQENWYNWNCQNWGSKWDTTDISFDYEDEAENWYGWNLTNWGSKWDVTDMFVDYEDDTKLILSFATAWSPITPIFDELVKRGFKVKAEYQDEGYMFAGQYEDGNETDFEILVCEDCQELDEPNYECKCEGNGVIILR